jgi:hypothetical protein
MTRGDRFRPVTISWNSLEPAAGNLSRLSMTTTIPRHRLTWTRSGRRSETAMANRWTMILRPRSAVLPTIRVQPIRGNNREASSDLGANSEVGVTNDLEATSGAAVAVVNEMATAEAIAASPAAKEANAHPVGSPNAARNARQVRAPKHRANNERGRIVAANNRAAKNRAEATKAQSEPLAKPPSDRLKAIAPTKAAGTPVAATTAKAASNPLVDLNVHNQPPPRPGEPLPTRLSLPAQRPKANQQKRNRCHIGNASPPCLD